MSAPLSGVFGQFGVVLRFEARVFGGQFAVLADVLANAEPPALGYSRLVSRGVRLRLALLRRKRVDFSDDLVGFRRIAKPREFPGQRSLEKRRPPL